MTNLDSDKVASFTSSPVKLKTETSIQLKLMEQQWHHSILTLQYG